MFPMWALLSLAWAGDATPIAVPISPWCFQEREPEASELLSNAIVSPVRPARMVGSIRDLHDRTVIELTRAQADSLSATSLPPRHQGSYHYLIRASVYAPTGATAAELVAQAHTARFEVEWFPANHRARIVTSQPSPPGHATYAQNIAMVLTIERPVSHVVVACYSIP